MRNNIKRTYICKDVFAQKIETEIAADYAPAVGDVAVFEVLTIGKHTTIQGDSKRNIKILPGDKIMAAFGTRYATEQFEGYVPDHVNQPLQILGAGGTVGVLASMHNKFQNVGPTELKFYGLVKDQFNKVVNTKRLKQQQMLTFSGSAASATNVILSLGSSMDSGKTTTAAYMIHGLKKAGFTVAFIKLTGTVYTKDCDLAYDLGADVSLDFSEFGFPSTYMCEEEELLDLYESLLSKVLPTRPDYVVMEIADGLYERETSMLLNNQRFIDSVDDVVFSAGDSLAAINGVSILQTKGIFPVAVCGVLTASPLLTREVKQHTTVPVFTLEDLSDAAIAANLFAREKMMAIN